MFLRKERVVQEGHQKNLGRRQVNNGLINKVDIARSFKMLKTLKFKNLLNWENF
jgi:hypothetical protein